MKNLLGLLGIIGFGLFVLTAAYYFHTKKNSGTFSNSISNVQAPAATSLSLVEETTTNISDRSLRPDISSSSVAILTLGTSSVSSRSTADANTTVPIERPSGIVASSASTSFASLEKPPAPGGQFIEDIGSELGYKQWFSGQDSLIYPDPLISIHGNQSLALHTNGKGDQASALAVNQGSFNLVDKYMEIWIRVSTTTDVRSLWFVASSDNLANNYFTWKLNTQILNSADESEIQSGQWVPLLLTFDSDGSNMVTTGKPDISRIDSFELIARDNGKEPVTVWLGGIAEVNEPPSGVVSIVLDNGWISEYTLAMPTLEKYNFPAVVAEIPQTAGNKNFMDIEQLKYLQNNLGWDIACHTWDHAYQLGLPSVNLSTIDMEMATCKDWLIKNGLGKAADVFVWPNGSNSSQAIAEAQKYFVVGRGIVGTAFNTLPPANPMLLYATEVGGDVSTSTLNADVDRCKANHEWCIFYGHIITLGPPENQDQYDKARFDDFIDHIAASGMPVKTITEVIKSL